MAILPNPMTWEVKPKIMSDDTFITMTASTVINTVLDYDNPSNPSDLITTAEYYFECVTDPILNSGWQENSRYDIYNGDNPSFDGSKDHSFRVKARIDGEGSDETSYSNTLVIQRSPYINIDIISPTTDIWTSSNDVLFDVNLSTPSPSGIEDSYCFIDWKDSLIGWWRGENNALDSSSKGNHGTLYGATNYGDGKFGRAFNFPASADYVDCGGEDDYLFGENDSFTIACWVYLTTAGSTSNIWSKSNMSNFELQYRSDLRWEVHLGVDGFVWEYDVDPNALNKWRHMIVTYNGDSQHVQLYRDGVH